MSEESSDEVLVETDVRRVGYERVSVFRVLFQEAEHPGSVVYEDLVGFREVSLLLLV